MQKEMDRATLVDVSRTSLRTKVHSDLADLLTEVNIHILNLQHTLMSFKFFINILAFTDTCIAGQTGYQSAFGHVNILPHIAEC